MPAHSQLHGFQRARRRNNSGFLASETRVFAFPLVLPSMGNRKKLRGQEPENGRQRRHRRRDDDRQLDQRSKPATKKHRRPVRHRKVQKTASLAETVRGVIAIYPDAIFEWPDGTCSISEFPKGPEISRRYRTPQRAWFDATRGCRKTAGSKGRRTVRTRPTKVG